MNWASQLTCFGVGPDCEGDVLCPPDRDRCSHPPPTRKAPRRSPPRSRDGRKRRCIIRPTTSGKLSGGLSAAPEEGAAATRPRVGSCRRLLLHQRASDRFQCIFSVRGTRVELPWYGLVADLAVDVSLSTKAAHAIDLPPAAQATPLELFQGLSDGPCVWYRFCFLFYATTDETFGPPHRPADPSPPTLPRVTFSWTPRKRSSHYTFPLRRLVRHHEL